MANDVADTAKDITEAKASLLKKYLPEAVIIALALTVMALALKVVSLYEKIDTMHEKTESFGRDINNRLIEANSLTPRYYENSNRSTSVDSFYRQR